MSFCDFRGRDHCAAIGPLLSRRRGGCTIREKSRSLISSCRRGGVVQEFLDHTTPAFGEPVPHLGLRSTSFSIWTHVGGDRGGVDLDRSRRESTLLPLIASGSALQHGSGFREPLLQERIRSFRASRSSSASNVFRRSLPMAYTAQDFSHGSSLWTRAAIAAS